MMGILRGLPEGLLELTKVQVGVYTVPSDECLVLIMACWRVIVVYGGLNSRGGGVKSISLESLRVGDSDGILGLSTDSP